MFTAFIWTILPSNSGIYNALPVHSTVYECFKAYSILYLWSRDEERESAGKCRGNFSHWTVRTTAYYSLCGIECGTFWVVGLLDGLDRNSVCQSLGSDRLTGFQTCYEIVWSSNPDWVIAQRMEMFKSNFFTQIRGGSGIFSPKNHVNILKIFKTILFQTISALSGVELTKLFLFSPCALMCIRVKKRKNTNQCWHFLNICGH